MVAAVNAVVISAGSMSDAICQSTPSEAVKSATLAAVPIHA
jgi:hypothetical protein